MNRTLGVVALFVISSTTLFAQATFPPSSFKNLQVLPKDATAGVVVGTMKGFTNEQLDAAVARAAGAEARVTCITCHRGKSTPTNTREP